MKTKKQLEAIRLALTGINPNSNSNKTGHWKLPSHLLDQKIPEWIGFVYLIVGPTRSYIGKKNIYSHTRKKIQGKTRKEVITKESNWKTYISSSKSLQEDIALRGKDKFEFRIISLHESKSSLAYAEVKILMDLDVLLHPDLFYNGIIPPLRGKIVISEKEKEVKTK